MTPLRSTTLPALALTAVCAIVGGVTAGREGALGAAAGGLLVCLLFLSNPVALGPVTKVVPQASVLVALTFFTTKILVLVAALSILLDEDGLGRHFDTMALGATVIVTTLAWVALLIRAARRRRQPLYDLRTED